MKQINIDDIRSYEPCYDPNRYLPEYFKGTVLDLLDNKQIPFQDRLWVILRPELLSEKLTRLFAVWCARQAQPLMPDVTSLKAIDVAEAFANGTATIKELNAARFAAGRVAVDAAWASAFDIAWVAAGTAAKFAGDATRAAQEIKLREMIIAGTETGDVL